MLTLSGHTGPVWSLAYSPDGACLASGSADHTVRLWDLRERRPLPPLFGHGNTVGAVAFAPTGDLLASAGRDGIIRLWHLTTRGDPVSLLRRQTLPITSAAFFPDGRSLATSAGVLTCVAVGPDGTVAAGSGYPDYVGRGAVTVWDVASDTAPARLELTDMGRWSAVYPAQERRAALVGSVRGVKLWRPAGDDPLRTLAHRHPVLAVASSPDGATVAGATGSTITLWDSATGQERARLGGHVGNVSSLAFTPDGTALLSGGIDRSVRLWDVASGRQRRSYGWRLGKVYAVAVAPDGLTAAAAGEAPQIVVWDLDSA
jgi:WD40 repeat protein